MGHRGCTGWIDDRLMCVGKAQITSKKQILTVEQKTERERKEEREEGKSCLTKGGCTSSVPLGDGRSEGKPPAPEQPFLPLDLGGS